ncbi:hypothetical protein SLEP1_g57150 [Rubroshorea leprosula]|uniref:Uncharacterized protein n=1 Tax=Rubroshorea leprosula TaxID=152421 RepID=A0AAV5MLP5_9ROSI|nr:hypothetical protein SLEP1_g57150 [Rubroshorea leprosula]
MKKQHEEEEMKCEVENKKNAKSKKTETDKGKEESNAAGAAAGAGPHTAAGVDCYQATLLLSNSKPSADPICWSCCRTGLLNSVSVLPPTVLPDYFTS